MAGVRGKRRSNGKYQGWFTDHTGRRRWFDGTRSKTETRQIAQSLEDRHRLIRLGHIPHETRENAAHFDDVVREYLAWGNMQGGKGGRPWNVTHAKNRLKHLRWWQERLQVRTVGELRYCLAPVEAALRDLQRTGRTRANYAESLRAFCLWCVERQYLLENPLRQFRRVDRRRQVTWRALTRDEISKLLDSVGPRRLLYEVALFSGLRASELRRLTPEHVSQEEHCLVLEAAWTKNHQPGFQPLPPWLIEKLMAPWQWHRQRWLGDIPLLNVPRDTARVFRRDCIAAGISNTDDLVFHSLRITYINLIIGAGVSVKEAQELARHATPDMTMNVYGRVQGSTLAAAVDRVSGQLGLTPERVTSVSEPQAQVANSPTNQEGISGSESGPMPDTLPRRTRHFHSTNSANTMHLRAVERVGVQKDTSREQIHSTHPHTDCVLCVSSGLSTLIQQWHQLRDDQRAEFLAWMDQFTTPPTNT